MMHPRIRTPTPSILWGYKTKETGIMMLHLKMAKKGGRLRLAVGNGWHLGRLILALFIKHLRMTIAVVSETEDT